MTIFSPPCLPQGTEVLILSEHLGDVGNGNFLYNLSSMCTIVSRSYLHMRRTGAIEKGDD